MTGMKSAQQTNSSVKNKPTRFNHTKVDKQSESLQFEKSMKCYNWKHQHTHTSTTQHSDLSTPTREVTRAVTFLSWVFVQPNSKNSDVRVFYSPM